MPLISKILFKKIAGIIVFSLLSLLIILLFLFINLPLIVESQIEKRLPQILNAHDIEFNIEKLGFSNTLISKIRMGKAVFIDSINIDYNYDTQERIPVHLDQVTVSGLTIHADLYENNQIKLTGFDFPAKSNNEKSLDYLSFLSFLPEKISFQNAKIVLHTSNDDFFIPFEILSTIKSRDAEIIADIQLFPFGEKIHASITYDVKKGIKFLKIEGKSFDSGHFDSLIAKKTDQLQLKGPIDFILETSSIQKKWKLGLSLGIVKPFETKIKDLSSVLLIDNKKIKVTGAFNFANSIIPLTRMEYVLDLNLEKGLKNNPLFDLKFQNTSLDVYKITRESDSLSLKKPRLNVQIRGSALKSKGKISLDIRNGHIKHQKQNLFFGDTKISADLIFDLTKTGHGLTSDIKAVTHNIKVKGLSEFNYPYKVGLHGKVLQTDKKQFHVSGGFDLEQLPYLKVGFKSAIKFDKAFYADLNFKTNKVKLNYDRIDTLFPQKLQAEIDMMVSAKGRAQFSNKKLKTSMQLKIIDGQIKIPDMNFTALGINSTVDLNDLLMVESVPGQELTIDSIEVDKIKIDNAKIRFSIEDGESLLIENIRFNWCNGLVSTESIRFPGKDNAYLLTLYCDRLELTQLLQQTGAFNSKGTGTLNGRIPVIYSDGNISFDNGFLFSTPGSGGKVVIENTDVITRGIPMDSPQFVQLDLAREALKDFDYEWVKLIFHTFDDTLYVNMELDGKPSKLLPFEYRKEFGGFIRVDASSPGSHFQGIKLDVNLQLPFNQVVKFGNKLKSILN